MCGGTLHSFCAAEAHREISAADPNVLEGTILCSVSCFRFSGIDGLTADAVKAERGALLQKNKEQLKKEAREFNVKVNYRVNGASRDAPKEIIVARLLEKKMLQLHPSLAATEVQPEASVATNKITINDKFRLINVVFSSELADTALTSEQTITRAELDAGLVGHNSPFWKMVESRFNSGFLPDGVDGIAHADLVHHIHPLFHQNDEKIDPGVHGQFTAEKLRSVWKDLQSEYDKVIVNFTKSGNHDSSFTRAAMLSLNKIDNNNNNESSSSSSLNDDDVHEGDDDEFGMESGGWCCFTNSLPVVYLRMWLNEKPDLTSSVSRQIPQDVQLDSAKVDEGQKKRRASDSTDNNNKSSAKKQKKSPSESIAEAFAGFVQLKEAESASRRSTITDSMGVELEKFLKMQSSKEAIELLEKQIAVISRRIELSESDEQRQHYKDALNKLECKLDNLVMST